MSLALRSKISSLLLASSLLFVGGNASAALLDAFENGGFEGYTGNTNSFNSDVPPGWTTTEGTPDVFNASTNFRGFTWKASSTGGDFLHGIGWGRQGGIALRRKCSAGWSGWIGYWAAIRDLV